MRIPVKMRRVKESYLSVGGVVPVYWGYLLKGQIWRHWEVIRSPCFARRQSYFGSSLHKYPPESQSDSRYSYPVFQLAGFLVVVLVATHIKSKEWRFVLV